MPRSATLVSASFDRTWGAVIDAFAARNIPIRTIEKASGLIATDALSIGVGGEAWADCGTIMGRTPPPTVATYNVRVKGDTTSSTVQFTVLWKRAYPGTAVTITDDCSTKGVWETEAESDVKRRAEGK